MHVHSPIFEGKLIKQKNRPLTLKAWVLGRAKKRQKINKNKLLTTINM